MSCGKNAGVILHFEHESLHFVVFHQLCFSRLRIHIHGTEFIDFKLSSVLSYAGLGKEKRTR